MAVLCAALVLPACSDDDGAPILELGERGPGTCVVAGPDIGPEVTGLPVVPCTEEHTHELYHVVDYEGADVFPGLAELDAFAERECIGAFEPYVGISVFDSELTFSWLVPTLTSWNDENDHAVYCMVGMFDSSTLTESVKDARR